MWVPALRVGTRVMGPYLAYYNYWRSHMTLAEGAGRKTTPAMAAGLADHVWTVAELPERVSARPA